MQPARHERLAALVAAHDGGASEPDLGALLDALDDAGGAEGAHELAASGESGDRRLAARLMQLLPEPGHVAVLERLVVDGDREVAAAARRSLRTQRRTPDWHAAVQRLAGAGDPELRATAQGWLQEGRR